MQQQVGSAVQAALSQTLPQELAGPHLKAALEASLGSQLQHALARPLQDSFTASFQHQLMPAFEGACRDMFTQVSPSVMQTPDLCCVLCAGHLQLLNVGCTEWTSGASCKEGALPLLGRGLEAADQSFLLSAHFHIGCTPVGVQWTHEQQQHA